MKRIALTQGKYALVDDEDYEELLKYKWRAWKSGNTFYTGRHSPMINGKRTTMFMHNMILGTPKGLHTDHKDGDGLNNQRSNLRLATPSENGANRLVGSNNTSGYKGISQKDKKWGAQITKNQKIVYLGRFETKIEAAKAYNTAAKKYHGEFARLNTI